MNISTSECGFHLTPLYFTSLDGMNDQYHMIGFGAIYAPTENTFKVFVRPTDTIAVVDMMPKSQTYKWDLHWLGILEWYA